MKKVPPPPRCFTYIKNFPIPRFIAPTRLLDTLEYSLDWRPPPVLKERRNCAPKMKKKMRAFPHKTRQITFNM